MPHVKLKLVEWRELEMKRRLVAVVTKAVRRSLPVTPGNVRIELTEIKTISSIFGQLIYDTRVDW